MPWWNIINYSDYWHGALDGIMRGMLFPLFVILVSSGDE